MDHESSNSYAKSDIKNPSLEFITGTLQPTNLTNVNASQWILKSILTQNTHFLLRNQRVCYLFSRVLLKE